MNSYCGWPTSLTYQSSVTKHVILIYFNHAWSVSDTDAPSQLAARTLLSQLESVCQTPVVNLRQALSSDKQIYLGSMELRKTEWSLTIQLKNHWLRILDCSYVTTRVSETAAKYFIQVWKQLPWLSNLEMALNQVNTRNFPIADCYSLSVSVKRSTLLFWLQGLSRTIPEL